MDILAENTAKLSNRELKTMLQSVQADTIFYDKGSYILTDDKAPVELLDSL